MSDFKVKVFDNFLSNDEVDLLHYIASESDAWENAGSPFWDNRSIGLGTIKSVYGDAFYNLLIAIGKRIQGAIIQEYSVSETYPDLINIIRWFPGMSQPPHADDMTNVVDQDHSAFHHREFGAIIYLNDNYHGGETYYPQHNFAIKPKAGSLAIHPGTPEYLHGVTEISGGIRYTISSFWTSDRSKSIV